MQQMNLDGHVAEMVPKRETTKSGLPLLRPGETRRTFSGSILWRPAKESAGEESLRIALSHVSDMLEGGHVTPKQAQGMVIESLERFASG